jgi:hypothetical protein
MNHSVLFYFKRKFIHKILDINFKNVNFDIDSYYNHIYETVNLFNKYLNLNSNVYLWPASIHSLYLFIFGLNYEKISGLLDNSMLKIGKKAYGTNLQIFSFSEKIKENITLLINGGVFNKEIENNLKINNIKYINI